MGFFIMTQVANSQNITVDTVVQSKAFGFLEEGVGVNKTIYGHFDDSLVVPIIFLGKSSANILYVVDDRHTYIFFKDKSFRIKKEHRSKLDLKDDVLREDDEVMISYISDEEYNKLVISSGYITLSYIKESERNKIVIVFHNVIFSER